MHLKFSKIIIIGICLITFFIQTKSVFAGSVNSNEARVITVARGTFEYDGEIYTAKQGYINQLIAKFSEEDIDLNADQASEAISGIYANVSAGVSEGYLEKVEGTIPNDSKNQNFDDVYPEEGNKNQGDNQNNKPPNHNSPNHNPESRNTDNGHSGEVLRYKAPSVIKNTGFSIYYTILVLLGGILILTVCIFHIRTNHFFADCNEE